MDNISETCNCVQPLAMHILQNNMGDILKGEWCSREHIQKNFGILKW